MRNLFRVMFQQGILPGQAALVSFIPGILLSCINDSPY